MHFNTICIRFFQITIEHFIKIFAASTQDHTIDGELLFVIGYQDTVTQGLAVLCFAVSVDLL